MKTIHTQRIFGKNSTAKILENIAIFTAGLMFFFLQMYLKIFEIHVKNNTN